MGLSPFLARLAVQATRVLVVEAPGQWATRMELEQQLLRRGWRIASSPAQGDVLVVCGAPGPELSDLANRLWEQMPEPKWCVAMGTCTTSGGRFKRSYSVVQGVDRVMPVDVYVPGCPPRPEGLIYGMLRLHELVKQRRGEWRTYVDRGPQRTRWEGDVR